MLPKEIQYIVAELLKLHDLSRLLCVNKDWNQLCAAVLWKNLDKTDSLAVDGSLLSNSLDNTETTHLIRFWGRNPTLQHLYIGRLCQLPGELLLAIDKHLPRLKTLSLFNLTRSDEPLGEQRHSFIGFWLLKAFLENLPSEYLALGAHTFWAHTFRSLQKRKQNEADYLDFERHFGAGNVQEHRQLRVAWIRGMGGDQDEVFPAFLRSSPSLEIADFVGLVHFQRHRHGEHRYPADFVHDIVASSV
ncbi:hypothetical protein BGX29_006969 [Mortierella sp. GBA35]|nr:hypothetical protein BGX29_006969 [Mortierella sp. GBA35]